MVSKPNIRAGEGLIRTHELFADLYEDVRVAYEMLEADTESQYLRRSAIRAVFSFIEAVIQIIKWELSSDLRLGDCSVTLTDREHVTLYERKISSESRRLYIPLEENIKRTFKLAKRVWELSEFVFDANEKGFTAIRRAKVARDRLFHPRRYYDIELTATEMACAIQGAGWICDKFLELMDFRIKEIRRGLPGDVVQSLDKLRDDD